MPYDSSAATRFSSETRNGQGSAQSFTCYPHHWHESHGHHLQNAFGDIDVRELLDAVRAPTLVLHAQHDQRITLEQGRELAIGIRGARFVPLESRSHIVLGHEPAWIVLMREVDQFLTEHEAG